MSVLFAIFTFFFLLEKYIPAYTLPVVRFWLVRALLINSIQLGIMMLAGVSWESWLSSFAIFTLSEYVYVSPITAGLIAYFISTFVFYWWHRWRHRSNILWRVLHQIHHSPQRVEVLASFYKHPIEMVVNSIISSLLVYTLLGLSVESVIVYSLCTTVADIFIHANIRTPYWLGFIFQRPEMHRVHHQYQYHQNNYGDIPWWDMLFGTYENPKTVNFRCGFDESRERNLWHMLRCKNIHKDN